MEENEHEEEEPIDKVCRTKAGPENDKMQLTLMIRCIRRIRGDIAKDNLI